MVSVVWKSRPTGALASRRFQGPFLIAEKLSNTSGCVRNAPVLTRIVNFRIRSLPKSYGHFSDHGAQQLKHFHPLGVGGRATAAGVSERN